MNLVTILNNRSIAGIQESELKIILEGNHPSIKLRMAANGMVMFTNNTIVKCVEEYYYNPNDPIDAKKLNQTAKCYHIIENLGLGGVDINRCGDCHLECLNKKNEGHIRRIYK